MTYWTRIVGAVPCMLIVENYAVSGYAAAHSGTRPAQPASDSSRERTHPRPPTTAARRDGRRITTESVWLRPRERWPPAIGRRWIARDLQSHAARGLHGESRQHQGRYCHQ